MSQAVRARRHDRLRAEASERTLEASDILVAAGRTPNTDRLDVAKAGVELDARGYIRVNERLQTTPRMFGPWANVPAARNSRMSARTIFASS